MALACACECVHTLCDVVEVSNVDLSAAAAAVARCERWEALLQGWGGGACARAYIIVDSQANREDHDEALVHTEPRAHEHDNTNHTEDHNADTDRRLWREGGRVCTRDVRACVCVRRERVCERRAALQCGRRERV